MQGEGRQLFPLDVRSGTGSQRGTEMMVAIAGDCLLWTACLSPHLYGAALIPCVMGFGGEAFER